jgi:hypothetical protein
MVYQPGGSAVPQRQQGVGNMNANRTQSYGSGLGSVYQYGQANPYGPTIGMQRGGQTPGTGTGLTAGQPGATSRESVARTYLTGTVQGQNTPFDQNTRNSMYSQASGMNAAAEGAQNQQMSEQAAMGGVSPTDPSYQAAQRQSMAMRQGANQRAMGQIDSQANLANQQAQSQAATTLLGSEDRNNALTMANSQAAQNAALQYLYGGGGSAQPRANSNYGYWSF